MKHRLHIQAGTSTGQKKVKKVDIRDKHMSFVDLKKAYDSVPSKNYRIQFKNSKRTNRRYQKPVQHRNEKHNDLQYNKGFLKPLFNFSNTV